MNRVQSTNASSDVAINWRPRDVLQPLEIPQSAPKHAADEDEGDSQKEESNKEPGNDHGYENH